MPRCWTEDLRIIAAGDVDSLAAFAAAPEWAAAILRRAEFLLVGRRDGADPRHLVAGRIAGRSVTGCGATLPDALQAAAGEGAEHLLLAGLDHDGLACRGDAGFDLWSGLPVGDGRGRLRFGLDRAPASEGCGAWTDPETSVAVAVLELVERDAAMLWWTGGRPGRLIHGERSGPDRASGERETILIDISGGQRIPVVAALSFDADGRGFASGVAAGLDRAAAIRGARRELAMVEMGRDIIRWKHARLGADSVNETDRAEERRGAAIDRAALLSEGVDARAPDIATERPAPRVRDAVAAALFSSGVDCAVFPLGDIHGCHVAKAVSAALQPSRPGVATERLARAQAEFGGPRPFTCGLPLY